MVSFRQFRMLTGDGVNARLWSLAVIDTVNHFTSAYALAPLGSCKSVSHAICAIPSPRR